MLESLREKIYRAEDLFLVSVLVTMMLFAVAQIVLRNVMGSGIVWGDSLVRLLVLWVGFVGAMTATRDNNHISIDVITRYLSPQRKSIARVFTGLFSGAICGLAAFYSYRFVQMEYEYDSPGFAAVPAWLCESIIPLAFVIISFRCFGHALVALISLLTGRFGEE